MVAKSVFLLILAILLCGQEAPKRPSEIIEASTDVKWLESIARSPEEAEKLNPRGRGVRRWHTMHAAAIRTCAYIRLGAIGTEESLAAVKRVEDELEQTPLLPDRVPLGAWRRHPFSWVERKVAPLARVCASDGTTYAIVRSDFFGSVLDDRMLTNDLHLISTRTPEDPLSWSRPYLVGCVGRKSPDPGLDLSEEDGVICSFREIGEEGLERRLSIGQILQDSDGDGWTDIEERRLGLDSRNGDSDGDGIPDGGDVCPNHDARTDGARKEEAQIITRAILAAFGFNRSRDLVLAKGEPAVQIRGLAAPVVYGSAPPAGEPRGLAVDWRFKERSEDEVVIKIHHVIVPRNSGGMGFHLRKIDGDWYVTRVGQSWVG